MQGEAYLRDTTVMVKQTCLPAHSQYNSHLDNNYIHNKEILRIRNMKGQYHVEGSTTTKNTTLTVCILLICRTYSYVLYI